MSRKSGWCLFDRWTKCLSWFGTTITCRQSYKEVVIIIFPSTLIIMDFLYSPFSRSFTFNFLFLFVIMNELWWDKVEHICSGKWGPNVSDIAKFIFHFKLLMYAKRLFRFCLTGSYYMQRKRHSSLSMIFWWRHTLLIVWLFLKEPRQNLLLHNRWFFY